MWRGVIYLIKLEASGEERPHNRVNIIKSHSLKYRRDEDPPHSNISMHDSMSADRTVREWGDMRARNTPRLEPMKSTPEVKTL